MQEDFNVWPPPPKGQAPLQPSPPLRPPVPPAIRRLGQEALVLVFLGIIDLALIFTGFPSRVYDNSNLHFPSHSWRYVMYLWLSIAAPFLFMGVYKGWLGRGAWTGKVALIIGGIVLVPYAPLLILTLRDALSL